MSGPSDGQGTHEWRELGRMGSSHLSNRKGQRMRRHLVAASATALFFVSAMVACSSDSGPKPALNDFLELWSHGKVDKAIVQDSAGNAVPDASGVSKINTLSGDLLPGQ